MLHLLIKIRSEWSRGFTSAQPDLKTEPLEELLLGELSSLLTERRMCVSLRSVAKCNALILLPTIYEFSKTWIQKFQSLLERLIQTILSADSDPTHLSAFLRGPALLQYSSLNCDVAPIVDQLWNNIWELPKDCFRSESFLLGLEAFTSLIRR